VATDSMLEQILTTGTVSDGVEQVTLRHPEFPDRFSHISRSTGELLQQAVRDVQPAVSLEVGLAYGISTMFICEAIASLPKPGVHIVLDPYQSGKWRGIGLRNVKAAGFGGIVEFHEEPSELFLPRLVAEGRQIDLAFIDGLHRFDQAFVEFFYINKLLRPGGVVLFDDAARRSVNRVVRHALTYPAYEVYGSTEPVAPERSWKGRVRRRAGELPMVQRIVKREVLERDWDLGIVGRCVALRKVAEDQRETHWDADF
jgi:predicted O-methyltransferase YrrM